MKCLLYLGEPWVIEVLDVSLIYQCSTAHFDVFPFRNVSSVANADDILSFSINQWNFNINYYYLDW